MPRTRLAVVRRLVPAGAALPVVLTVAVAVGLMLAAPASQAAPAQPDPPSPHYSDGHPRDARLTIPSRPRIHRLPVIAYRGRTDDGPGTRIQNRGIAASPYGPRGGVGPGGVGNYQVTAHRTAAGGIFRRTPSLKHLARVFVDAGRYRYVYRIHRTRWVDFRSPTSLRRQRAAVPGHPHRTAHRAYITISTCATIEDHRHGDYWTDRFGNPQHRIDKIGVLVKRIKNPYWGR